MDGQYRNHLHRHVHGHGARHIHSGPGPRIPTRQVDQREAMPNLTSMLNEMPSRLLRRKDCEPGDNSAECEKPVGSLTLPVTLGVIGGVIIAICVLYYLHRKTTKRLQLEDIDDKYKSLDFGVETGTATGKGGKRKSAMFGGEKGLAPIHTKGLSMDMNLSSPYLLPPDLQQSRESLNSLAKTIHQQEDPYRSIASFTHSDTGSMRSFPRGPSDRGSSVYGSKSPDPFRPRPIATNVPARQMSLPTPTGPLSPVPPAAQEPGRQAFRDPTSPQSAPPAKSDFRFTEAEFDQPQSPYVNMPAMPEVAEPAPVARKDMPPQNMRPMSNEALKVERGAPGDRDSAALPSSDPRRNVPSGLGIMDHGTLPSPPPTGALPQTPRSGRKDSKPVVSEVPSEYEDYAANQFQFGLNEGEQGAPEERGRQASRPYEADQEYPQSAGLNVPQKAANNNNRVSVVGFRPLPPDDFLESEDPEFRANRIRSFYKEYFDDSKEQRPPMPQLQSAQYYEDNYAGHMGDAAYFDPDSNTFVMPYAEPVTRRAMTPPPSNRRPMPGQRQQGPGGPHGSFGPGPRGPPMGRPRAGSTMSAARFGPRPGSSASARPGPRGPKKPIPPPSALNTLPTPGMLKDDTFMISDPLAFAPPPTFKDRVAGRSQSPAGERRPYQLGVPIASPLNSAFDEMAALPSPHVLRKSSTFTGLDFAPPKRFKDPEAMSDAGSVRSMGSGISSRANTAIRSGAGRVSRLPTDEVFTTAGTDSALKPKWGMRDL